MAEKEKCKKHILVVSQYFHPETFRINDMCTEWVKRGYKVTVITGIPNYPMGKTFEGYGLNKRRHEEWNGVEIMRIPLVPRGKGSIGMMLNYVSFMISGIVAGKCKKVKADVVFSFEVSPMTQVLSGVSFAKRLKVPHFLYVQDLWPENVITVTGIHNPVVIGPIQKMVDYIYKNTDEIFATSRSFVNAICDRKKKVPSEKVHYWPQYAEEFYHPEDKIKAKEEIRKMGISEDNSFKVVFTGNIGTAQGLQILPRTADILKAENIKFVLVGDGRYLEEFNKEVADRKLEDKFIMIERQPAEKISMILAWCDVAFISFANDELWTKTIPAKLQSYMACGMPVVASAQGETEKIINEAKCGKCVPIGDEKALAEAISNMMNENLVSMGNNSRQYFLSHFDKQKLMDEMDDYFARRGISNDTQDKK